MRIQETRARECECVAVDGHMLTHSFLLAKQSSLSAGIIIRSSFLIRNEHVVYEQFVLQELFVLSLSCLEMSR